MSNQTDYPNRFTRRTALAALASMPAAAAVSRPSPPRDAQAIGRLGKVQVSRLIFGGNQIADYNHCTRLPYVNQLVSAYYTPEKIASTLQLSEKCGVNTILTNPTFFPKLKDYWKNSNGKIQLISDCGHPSNLHEAIQKSIDFGAVACYIHGAVADRLARERKFDEMGKALDLMRKNGVPAGIGGHQLRTVRYAVEAGLQPDYWMLTFHPMKWGEAGELHPGFDEIHCPNPEEVAAFMKERKEPWIAFKTLAVGVIPPAEAFKFAFDNGADFVCVGMFEWQLADNVNIALDAIKGAAKRPRPWRA